MISKIRNLRLKALTLVELLITLLIITGMIITLGAVLTTVLRASYSADARLAVRENSEFSMEIFRRYLKSAQSGSFTTRNSTDFQQTGTSQQGQGTLIEFKLNGDEAIYRFRLGQELVNDRSIGRVYLEKNPTYLDDPNSLVESSLVLTYRDTNIDTTQSYFSYSKQNDHTLLVFHLLSDSSLQLDQTNAVVEDLPAETSVQVR